MQKAVRNSGRLFCLRQSSSCWWNATVGRVLRTSCREAYPAAVTLHLSPIANLSGHSPFLRAEFSQVVNRSNKLILKSEMVSVFWFLNTPFIN
jgi:hypothetical protein